MTILVSHQAAPLTFYNEIAPMLEQQKGRPNVSVCAAEENLEEEI